MVDYIGDLSGLDYLDLLITVLELSSGSWLLDWGRLCFVPNPWTFLGVVCLSITKLMLSIFF